MTIGPPRTSDLHLTATALGGSGRRTGHDVHGVKGLVQMLSLSRTLSGGRAPGSFGIYSLSTWDPIAAVRGARE